MAVSAKSVKRFDDSMSETTPAVEEKGGFRMAPIGSGGVTGVVVVRSSESQSL